MSMSPDGLDDGLIVYDAAAVRVGAVHPYSRMSYLIEDRSIDVYRKILASLRPQGTGIFQQLWHCGHVWPGGLCKKKWEVF